MISQEEFNKLKKDDLIEFQDFRTGKWTAARVTRLDTETDGGVLYVHCRLSGRTNRGRLYPERCYGRGSIRIVTSDISPLPANIYADYLEEHGELKAADMLRKAFPIDNGKE